VNRQGAGPKLALIAVLLVATAPTRAQAAADNAGERQLTLDDALGMAKKHNWNLAAERARVAQAQTAIDQAWAILLPTIAAQGKYTRNYKGILFPGPIITDPQGQPILGPDNLAQHAPGILIQPLNQLDGVISFSAPLIVPAAYPGLQAVKANVHASEANYEATEANILFGVAQAFFGAAIADEVLAARHSSIEVTRATLANAKTRFAAGTVTKVDVDRAELAVLRAEQLEREARHGRNQAYRGLSTLIQINGPFRIVLPPEPTAPVAEPSLENSLQLRPEFRALELTSYAADKQRQTDALRWSPSISAFGNARRFNYDNFVRDHYSWAVGLQLDWVIFDGGNRDALRHQAAAQQAEADARAAALRDNIRDDLATERSLLETKQHAVEAASRAVVLSQETIDLVRTQYEAGTVTQVDLLQAQDNLVAAQEALAQARFDVAVADLTLRRVAGTFPPR
jgi:outer membrane protein TolC